MKLVALALAALAGASFLLFCLLIVVKSYRGGRSDYIRNPSADISRHPERTEIPRLREISFAAPDGSRIAAWYAQSLNRAAVVLVHGTQADRSGVLWETRVLAKAGFGALALDLPGQGASGGRTYWGVPDSQAISAAVDWLTARPEVDPGRIGAFGQSMGGYVMVRAAVADKRLAAVVLESCPNDVVEQNWLGSSDWGLLSELPNYWALRVSGQPFDMKPKDVIGALSPRRLLVIGGELDDLVPAFMARQIYDAAREPKEMWIVPSAHHVDFPQLVPEEYSRRLLDFYSRSLLAR